MFRKLKPDTIFTGFKMLPPGKVLVIDQSGKIEDIIDKEDAGDNIENINGILSPGFINSHCHIELSYLKGKIEMGIGLVNFVLAVMGGRSASGEAKLSAMQEAVTEMHGNGIVAIGDICNTTDSIAVKQDNVFYWQNFIEVAGFIDVNYQERFQLGSQVRDAFQAILPAQPTSIVPHAPYSVSKSLFHQINSATAGQLISIHNQESEAEDQLFISRQGDMLRLYDTLGLDISGFEPSRKSSLQTWLPFFTHGQKILAVHDSFTNQADIDVARRCRDGALLQDLYFCLCPNANLYIENRLPPVELFVNNQCNIILGTDSYASNHQLDIMAEIRLLRKEFPAIPLEAMLQWATSKAATAFGIDAIFGSIKKGKQPGIVHISEDMRAQRIA